MKDYFFYYYKFHLLNKENILIKKSVINQEGNIYAYQIQDHGLSCQLMNFNFNDKILSCFFVETVTPNKISTFDYSINETDIQLKTRGIMKYQLMFQALLYCNTYFCLSLLYQ